MKLSRRLLTVKYSTFLSTVVGGSLLMTTLLVVMTTDFCDYTRQPFIVDMSVDDDPPIWVNASERVVNPHQFRVTINCPQLCTAPPDDDRPLLLVYVHTSLPNYLLRYRIRLTWGRADNYPSVRVRTVFIVGLSDRSYDVMPLHDEALQYNDIVQENFVDSYRNLTYKGVAALRWISTYCRHAAYVIKTDDDVFINMFTIVQHVRRLYDARHRSHFITCFVWRHAPVFRYGRWRVPRSVLPTDEYPPYCGGLFALMSADVAVAAYRASFHVRFFWIDDVYVTGLLMDVLRVNVTSADGVSVTSVPAVKHVDMRVAMCNQSEMTELYVKTTEWYKYAFTHVHNDKLFWTTWALLHYFARRRTIPTPTVLRPGLLADKYIPLKEIFPDMVYRRRHWAEMEKKRRRYADMKYRRKQRRVQLQQRQQRRRLRQHQNN